MLNEKSQTEIATYCMIPYIYIYMTFWKKTKLQGPKKKKIDQWMPELEMEEGTDYKGA